MIFAYKNSNKPPNFLAKSRLYKNYDKPYELDDDMKYDIQTTFLQILNLKQTKTIEEFITIFKNIEEIINIEEYQGFIPKIVPISIYPELVQILSEIEDEYVHRIISRIIVFLTNDVTDSLIQFAELNLMEALYLSIPSTNVMKFPGSIEYIFQIIANFLDDPCQDICEYAHQYFKIDILFEIFDKINEIADDTKLNETNSFSMLQITKRWMKCVFTTIYKFPLELTKDDTTQILNRIHKHFDLLFEEPILCIYLCCSINKLIDLDEIEYDEFNKMNYPNYFFTTSCLDCILVKTYSFITIGLLISKDKFTATCDFSYFFDAVLESNDKNLIASALYACHSCFGNKKFYEMAFTVTTKNMPFLIDLYDRENVIIKNELKKLFAFYIEHCIKFHKDDFAYYEDIIFSITNIFFDFIQVEDEYSNTLELTVRSLYHLNKYFNITGQDNLPSAAQYIEQYRECIEFLSGSEIAEISEFGYKLIALEEKNNDLIEN